MLKHIRLTWKLPVFIILFVIVAAAVTALVAYDQAKLALHNETTNKLVALRDARKQAISDYLATIREDLLVTANNHMVRQALSDFNNIGEGLQGDIREVLQRAYIDENPNPVGKKHLLDQARDESIYSELHGRHHPWFRQLLIARGYYDIFLISPDGTVIYTVFKERDFATNVMTGAHRDSDLGNAFRAISTNGRAGGVSLLDFKPYEPSAGAAASFIGTAVRNAEGKFIGALVFQMPIDRINQVMQVSAGMGETGETYLVGSDFLMRSDSRFSKESSILKTKVDGPTVQAALAGKSGVETVLDYRGVPVLSAYDKLDFEGVQMAVMAEIDADEADQPVVIMRNYILIGSTIVVIVTAVFAFFLALTLSRPIGAITGVMNILAKGNLNVDITGSERGDEIGDMAKAVNVFKQNAIKIREMEQITDNIIASITATTTEVAASVSEQAASSSEQAAAVTQTSTSLEEIRETAESAMNQADGMRADAEHTLVQGEAGKSRMTYAVSAMNDIREKVQAIANTMVILSEQTRRVGEITDSVSALAQQSKMLAINASIEAAKAGEAGQGFAVVAEEVANLAEQSDQATIQVRSVLEQIQAASEKAIFATEEGTKQVDAGVQMIHDVGESVENLLMVIGDTASSTSRMVDSIKQQATGIHQVSGAMNDITQGSSQIAASTSQIRTALEGLTVEVEKLNTLRNAS